MSPLHDALSKEKSCALTMEMVDQSVRRCRDRWYDQLSVVMWSLIRLKDLFDAISLQIISTGVWGQHPKTGSRGSAPSVLLVAVQGGVEG